MIVTNLSQKNITLSWSLSHTIVAKKGVLTNPYTGQHAVIAVHGRADQAPTSRRVKATNASINAITAPAPRMIMFRAIKPVRITSTPS